MTADNITRVGKVLKEFNIGLGTLVDYLKSKKIEIEASPGTKITPETYELIRKEFGKEQIIKEQSKKIAIKVKDITDKADNHDSEDSEDDLPVKEVFIKTSVSDHPSPKIIGKIDIDKLYKPAPHPEIVNVVHKPEQEIIKPVESIPSPEINEISKPEEKAEPIAAPQVKEPEEIA